MIRVKGKWSGKLASAIQWDGHNILACSEMAGANLEAVNGILTVPDDDGVAPLKIGDWLLKPDDHAWLVSCYNAIFPQIFVEVEQ